jgi:hypothetical protein
LISRACHGLRRLARNKKMPYRLRQSNPTGKSLLFLRNSVKPKISWNQKYFAFPEERNGAYLSSSRPDQSNCVGSSPVIGRPQGWRWRAPACGG